MSALGFVNPAMDPDVTVARRRPLLLPRLLLVPLLLSGLAQGRLPLGSSPHRVLYDFLSEQQLLEVEDLSLTLLQRGRLGLLSLPPDLPDLDPECRELLLDFANSSAELTGCLVRGARPVRLCQTCYPLFQQVASKMDNISRAVEREGQRSRHINQTEQRRFFPFLYSEPYSKFQSQSRKCRRRKCKEHGH